MSTQETIQRLYDQDTFDSEDRKALESFLDQLDRGEIRAAQKVGDQWQVNAWVKQGILAGFRMGALTDQSIDENFHFFDKDTFPLKSLQLDSGVRLVPGGSSIRRGAYVASGVTCMPPMYINVGAYLDEGTMVDSHALVGSCAQIGKRVHISAAAQIGGVLEPVGALPVIVEDKVLVGGNCGIYEGTIVPCRVQLKGGPADSEQSSQVNEGFQHRCNRWEEDGLSARISLNPKDPLPGSSARHPHGEEPPPSVQPGWDRMPGGSCGRPPAVPYPREPSW